MVSFGGCTSKERDKKEKSKIRLNQDPIIDAVSNDINSVLLLEVEPTK